MEQKLQRGYRVEILSRMDGNGLSHNNWENTEVGAEAIVKYSNIELPRRPDGNWENIYNDYEEDGPCYRLFVFPPDGFPYSLKWFEEKHLRLICWNEEKGKTILAVNGR